MVDVYQSFGRMGVPLFVMLTGALLLTPSKIDENLGVFFKKRFSRIGLPLIFWGIVYFAWDFLVENKPFSPDFVIQSILTGPYLQFWYMYMLVGLYLLTPFLRVMVAHANKQLFKYFAVLWFVGTAFVPFINLLTSYKVDGNFFLIPAFVGYFILGAYLVNVQVHRRILVALMAAGLFLTAFGTYILAWIVGGTTQYFFQEYVSPTTILASVAFFLLLNTVKMPVTVKSSRPSLGRRLMRLISENTLAIFFLHLIVLYIIQRGYGGFALNGNTVNSIVGVPLAAVLTLFICLAIIVPLKKVPYLKKFIG